MKILQNFLFVLNRFKVSSLLNIFGLTTAFAAFLILVIQVNFEYGFEKYHPNAARIYRVDGANTVNGDEWCIHSYPFVETVIQSSPHILAGTLINPYLDNFYITIETDGVQKGFKERFVTCDADITKVFNFQMLEGSAGCLKNQEMAIIPQSMAVRLFGTESAIGKQLTLTGRLWTKDRDFLIVGGVYKDFPANTQLNNDIYTAINGESYLQNDWRSQNYFCYILLDEHVSPEEIAENFNKNFDFQLIGRENTQIKLVPLTSLYFKNQDPSGQLIKSGSPSTPLILLTIGILIVVIAIINYTNFGMALAPVRMRNINTRKILGSTNQTLQLTIIAESVLMSLLSFGLSIALVSLLYESKELPFIQADINPVNNIPAILLTGLIALFAGIIAGIRPAFYMTSRPPVLALTGSFGLSQSGKRLRTVLIGFQFIISIVLITVAFFVYKQNHFMQKYTLGYDTDNIALVELPQSISGKGKQTFVSKLKENPDITNAAFSQQKFGAKDGYRTWSGTYKEEYVGFYSLSVSWNFPAVMGIPAVEGRLPEERDDDNSKNSPVYYVINRTMQKEYNIHADDVIDVDFRRKDNPDNGRVLGIVEDVKFSSLRNQVENMAFVFNDGNGQNWSYIRIKAGADIRQTAKYIEKTIAEFDSAYPSKIEFYDEVFDALYRQEINAERVITLFGLLAVIIAIAGVFGLVMFECAYKRKEIGIRKVMGSTEPEILLLFNRIYLRIFGVCFVIAVPIGYYIVKRWLENFAYKTPMDWWGFALVGVLVLLIIVCTVSWQSWRAATANPVNALKSE
ncbi:ABC transporter permease [Bacteroidia bacterium]|nr:ABC transporter permease [Bacteroidia bacterium]